MDTIQCAVVLAKLERFDWELERRHEVGKRYLELLGESDSIISPIVREDRSCVWGQFTVRSEDPPECILDKLKSEGVPTAIHYSVPLHRQPAYENICCITGTLDHSDQLSNRVFSLPHPYLNSETQKRIVRLALQNSTTINTQLMRNNHLSTIPFHITKKSAFLTFFILLFFDFFFVTAYLISTLPEIKSLTISHRLAFLDLDTEANLPTNYAILKLYFSSIACVLMVFWYRLQSPLFWKIAALVLFLIGLDESAQLHELWAAGLATKLFGTKYFSGNQFTIFPYAIILGTFYLSSLSLFPKHSKTVFVCFFMSGISFILSQAAEWSFQPAMQLMLASFDTFSPLLRNFSERSMMFAWEEGLEMFGYTLLSSGLLTGIYVIQNQTDQAIDQ